MATPRWPTASPPVVRPGADGFVQSDVRDIALDAMATFERDERFVNERGIEWVASTVAMWTKMS